MDRCSLKSYKTQKNYPFKFKTTLYTNESPDNTGHRPPLHIHTTMLYVPFSPLVLRQYSVQCSCKCIHNRIDNSVHTVRWHCLPFALFWGGFPFDILPKHTDTQLPEYLWHFVARKMKFCPAIQSWQIIIHDNSHSVQMCTLLCSRCRLVWVLRCFNVYQRALWTSPIFWYTLLCPYLELAGWLARRRGKTTNLCVLECLTVYLESCPNLKRILLTKSIHKPPME